MSRVLVAPPVEPPASPTLEASSAPRTETMTAAPASAHSSHQEVHCVNQMVLLICPRLNLSLFITRLVKHFYPPPCKCPAVHFIFPLHQYSYCRLTAVHLGVMFHELVFSQFWCFSLNSLTHFLCRLVVWCLWPVQSQWHILPCFIQCGSQQRH